MKEHEKPMEIISRLNGMRKEEISVFGQPSFTDIKDYDPAVMDLAFERLKKEEPKLYKFFCDVSNADDVYANLKVGEFSRFKKNGTRFLINFYMQEKEKLKGYSKDSAVEYIGLSNAVVDALHTQNIYTVRDISALRDKLHKMRGIGEVALNEIYHKMEEIGFPMEIAGYNKYDYESFIKKEITPVSIEVTERIIRQVFYMTMGEYQFFPTKDYEKIYIRKSLELLKKEYVKAYNVIMIDADNPSLSMIEIAQITGLYPTQIHTQKVLAKKMICYYYGCLEEEDIGFSEDSPLDRIWLPRKVYNVLVRYGYKTVNDILLEYAMDKNFAMKMSGFGHKKMWILRQTMKRIGYPLD